MIKTLPKCYRKDSWVNAIYDSVAKEFETFKINNQSNLDNLNFDTLDERGCTLYEKDLAIKYNENRTIQERRALIKAKWNANYKCSVQQLQQLADGYYNGCLTVSYKGDAWLRFSTKGINYFDTDFTEFLRVVDELKPAHFGIKWDYYHNKWYEYYNPVVWRSGLDWTWKGEESTPWEDVDGVKLKTTWGYCITRKWSGHLTERIRYNGE